MDSSESITTHSLAITGCGVLSSVGTGFDEFTEAFRAGRSGRTPVDGLFDEPLPSVEACVVPDFKASDFLGVKGTSFFDRTTGLVVVTCGLALEDSDLSVTDQNRAQIGVMIGTSTGSIKSISDYVRETLVQDRPYLVNPVLFPNTVMNCAAGQAAIWYALKGVNATIAGGQLSSLMALRYASVAIHQGYADVLLVGAVEEFCPQTAWGFHHSEVLKDTNTLVGEGCAVFVIEDAIMAQDAGRSPIAEILACEVGVYGEAGRDLELSKGLAECIRRALGRAELAPEQVWTVSGSFVGDPLLDRVEEEGIRLGLHGMPTQLLRIKELVGECYSAAGVFQLAALLSTYRINDTEAKRISLVTSVGRDGTVGCAVIRG